MGWQDLTLTLSKGEGTPDPLFKGLYDPQALPSFGGVGGGYVYFVHSYYVPLCEETIATANYILPYSASMHKDNFYACQFHPEKSGKVGEQILQSFLAI
jgi:glutamine amidotransferase